MALRASAATLLVRHAVLAPTSSPYDVRPAYSVQVRANDIFEGYRQERPRLYTGCTKWFIREVDCTFQVVRLSIT